MPFVPLLDVPEQAVDWLWPGRLARGHVHLLDGDPDRGKSLVLLDLAARLTSGRPLPDGTAAVAPMTVIVLNAEDGAGSTVRPRLRAAGADLARVHIWDRAPGETPYRLPSQIDR